MIYSLTCIHTSTQYKCEKKSDLSVSVLEINLMRKHQCNRPVNDAKLHFTFTETLEKERTQQKMRHMPGEKRDI